MWCDEHEVINTCECGANNICYYCGIGQGSYPCECSPAPKIEYIIDDSGIDVILVTDKVDAV